MRPFSTLTLRSLALISAAAALLAGCTSTVNLAARRAAYDAYLDLPTQGQASVQEKSAFYDELLRHTSKPRAVPYPTLKADLQVMQRNVDAIASRRQAIKSFESTYDQFASTRAEVRSDQPAEWQQYLALDGQFQPLGQSMQVSLQAFNAALDDFNAQLVAHGIAGLDAEELRSEIEDHRDQMDQVLSSYEAQAHEDAKALALAAVTGGDHKILAKKGEILANLQRELLGAEEFQRSARANADSLYASVPTQGNFWTGPGMADDGRRLTRLRQDETVFAQRERVLNDLAQRFNAPVPVEKKQDDHKDGDHHDDHSNQHP